MKARTPQLAAIVLSGYSEFEYARTSLRLGIADYLLKPVRTDALHQAVARALEATTAERTHATHLREAELAVLLLGGQRATSADPNLLAGDRGVVVLICENWEGPTIWQTRRSTALLSHSRSALMCRMTLTSSTSTRVAAWCSCRWQARSCTCSTQLHSASTARLRPPASSRTPPTP